MKLLTVTVPCYNSQDYMEKCIESLLAGGERVEIVIIDDGSKDRTGEIADAFAEKYPKGFSDYLPDIVKFPKPDGTFFDAVTIEIPDAIYLVKINVKIDDLEDIEKWLDGEEDAENEAVAGGSADAADAGDNTLPDDNIAQYGDASDDAGE